MGLWKNKNFSFFEGVGGEQVGLMPACLRLLLEKGAELSLSAVEAWGVTNLFFSFRFTKHRDYERIKFKTGSLPGFFFETFFFKASFLWDQHDLSQMTKVDTILRNYCFEEFSGKLNVPWAKLTATVTIQNIDLGGGG